MPVNLSIKNVPDDLAKRLRERAERNHRSLQGELMAILETAANELYGIRTGTSKYELESASALADSLLEKLVAIVGERGIDPSRQLTRGPSSERKVLRKQSV